MPPPPPPPPAPPPGFGQSKKTTPAASSNNRGALLADIRGGMKLKKAVTNDRSAPVIEGKVSGGRDSANHTRGDHSPAGPPSALGSAGPRMSNMNQLIAERASKLRSVSTAEGTPRRTANGPMRALPAHNALPAPATAARGQGQTRVAPPAPPPPSSKPVARNSISGPPGFSSVAPRPFPGVRPAPRPQQQQQQQVPPSGPVPGLNRPAPPPTVSRPLLSGSSRTSSVDSAGAGRVRPVSVFETRGEAPEPPGLRSAVSSSQLRDPVRSPDSGYSPSPQGWRPPSAPTPVPAPAPAPAASRPARMQRSPSYNSVLPGAQAQAQAPPPPPPQSKPHAHGPRPYSMGAAPGPAPPLPSTKPYGNPNVKPQAPAVPPALPSRQRPPSLSTSSTNSNHSYHQPSSPRVVSAFPSSSPSRNEYSNGSVLTGVEPAPQLHRQLSSSSSMLTANRPPPPPPPRSGRVAPPAPTRPVPQPPSAMSPTWGLEARCHFRPISALPEPNFPTFFGEKRYPSHRSHQRAAPAAYDQRPVAPHPPARPPR